jgi:hypothetical protein
LNFGGEIVNFGAGSLLSLLIFFVGMAKAFQETLSIPEVSPEALELVGQFAAPLPALYAVEWNEFKHMLIFQLKDIDNFLNPEFRKRARLGHWLNNHPVERYLTKPSIDLMAELKGEFQYWKRNYTLEAEVSKLGSGAEEGSQMIVCAYQPQSQKQQLAGYALMALHFLGSGGSDETAVMVFKEDQYIIVSNGGNIRTPDFELLRATAGRGIKIPLLTRTKEPAALQIYSELKLYFHMYLGTLDEF